jgi:hypothetical protein
MSNGYMSFKNHLTTFFIKNLKKKFEMNLLLLKFEHNKLLCVNLDNFFYKNCINDVIIWL